MCPVLPWYGSTFVKTVGQKEVRCRLQFWKHFFGDKLIKACLFGEQLINNRHVYVSSHLILLNNPEN